MKPENYIYLLLCSEKLKSHLITISKLVQKYYGLHMEERKVASKILNYYLKIVESEAQIAYNITKNNGFLEVKGIILNLINFIDISSNRENIERISRALSIITTCAINAVQSLLNYDLDLTN